MIYNDDANSKVFIKPLKIDFTLKTKMAIEFDNPIYFLFKLSGCHLIRILRFNEIINPTVQA